MMRRPKNIALALAALALAVSAAVSSSGSTPTATAGPVIHTAVSEAETTILVAELEETLRLTLGEAEMFCENGTTEVTTELNEVQEATIPPLPSFDCTLGGLGEVTIDTNECDYLVTGETDKNGDAPVHIECPEEQVIEVEIPEICTITFGPQTPTGGGHATNLEEGGEQVVTIRGTAGGIEVEEKIGELCFLVGGETATIEGSAIVRGYEDVEGEPGEQVGIWIE